MTALALPRKTSSPSSCRLKAVNTELKLELRLKRTLMLGLDLVLSLGLKLGGVGRTWDKIVKLGIHCEFRVCGVGYAWGWVYSALLKIGLEPKLGPRDQPGTGAQHTHRAGAKT